MATVRITNQIKMDVSNSINNLYADRIVALTNKFAEIDMRDLTKRFLGTKFSDLADNLNSDPQGPWVHSASQHVFELRHPKNSRSITVSIPYPKNISVPHRATGYSFRIPVKPDSPEYSQIMAIHDEIQRVTIERDSLGAKIRELLEACGTLKQVLDVWPTALEFMSDEVKAQHAKSEKKEKVERVKRQKAVIDDATKVALLSARMLAK